jgi:glycosyltransferase involved in cell wall biosynthesis
MMKDSPLVSVIIPAFNASRYIAEAVQSVLDQTYRNIEVIVIDDCSSDDTYQICLKMAEADARLQIFRNDVNRKIAASLNLAISLSKGEFVARMDADDICLPQRIAHQLNYLQSNSEFAMVGSAVAIIDSRGEFLSTQTMPVFPKCMKALRFGSTVAHPTWFARRKFFTTVGDYRIAGAEDYDYLLRASALGLKMSNVAEVLLKYRVSDTNSSYQYGLKQVKLVSYVKAVNGICAYCRRLVHDEVTMEKHISYSPFAARLYGFSQIFFDRAYLSKGFIGKILNFTMAAVVSHYGALRLFRALVWKLVTR